MDTIFLDASIFIKENFLAGKKINQLLRLSENGYIDIITTQLTIDEVKNKFHVWTRETERYYKAVKKKNEVKSLWNTSIGKKALVEIKTEDICKEFNSKFDKNLKQSNVLVVDYSAIDIKDIFQKYFSNSYPFNTGDKKSEFPDAVILKLLEGWCNDNTKNCIVFSNDGDFLNYKHPSLTIRKDYDIYLSEKLKEMDKARSELLDKLYIDQRPVWQEEVKKWVNEQLEEWDRFDSFVNDHEIHDVSDIEVEILHDEYNVIQLIHDQDEIKIEVTIKVSIKAKVEADDPSFFYKDSDDKSIHYYDTATTEVNIIEFIPCIFSILLISEDDNAGEFTIEEFNNGEPLSIAPDWDY